MVSETFTQKRRARCLFVARAKATDMISGMQLDGLTTHLSEGGCCILTRKAPFSQDTPILVEISKDGVSLRTHATVIYNLKDQIMGLRFVEIPSDQATVLADWMKAAAVNFSKNAL